MIFVATPTVVAGLASISLLAGVAKGLTGFGGALVMAPLFGMLIGMPNAAALIVLVHGVTSLQGMRGWGCSVRWRSVLPLGALAVTCATLAAPLIAGANAQVLRHATAVAVLAVTGLHMTGWRWRHGSSVAATLATGVMSGALTALAGLGGPPAVFYFAGIAEGAVLRANLLGYFAVLFCGTALLFIVNGHIGRTQLATAAALTPAFILGVSLGTRGMRFLSPSRFNYAVSALLLISGCIALVG